MAGPYTHKPGPLMAFYRPQAHFDTIVFVHGFLLGHYIKTWAKFPKLLHEDPDLPHLDLFLWGYRTGIIQGNDVITDSARLISDLRILIKPDTSICLVGHSMGGLVILKGLRDQMFSALANAHPCSSVRFVSLFATPLTGSWMARVIRRPTKCWGFLCAQIRNLDRHFCDELILDVWDRIYRPTVEDRSARKISIRMHVGTRDKFVAEADRSSALARFRDPPPSVLDNSHASVKEPSDRLDLRYLALQEDIQEGLADSFRELSRRCFLSRAPNERVTAWVEIQRRYGTLAKRRVRKMLSKAIQKRAIKHVLILAAEDALKSHRPPFETISRAAMTLAQRV